MAATTRALHYKAGDNTLLKPSQFYRNAANARHAFWFGGELTAAAGTVSVGGYDLGLTFESGWIMRGVITLRTPGTQSTTRMKLKLNGLTDIWDSGAPAFGSGVKAIYMVPGNLGTTAVLPIAGYPIAVGDLLTLSVSAVDSGVAGLACWLLIAPDV